MLEHIDREPFGLDPDVSGGVVVPGPVLARGQADGDAGRPDPLAQVDQRVAEGRLGEQYPLRREGGRRRIVTRGVADEHEAVPRVERGHRRRPGEPEEVVHAGQLIRRDPVQRARDEGQHAEPVAP